HRPPAWVGHRLQRCHQPGRSPYPEGRLLQVRDPHRRPAGPLTSVPRRAAEPERVMTQWLANLIATWGLPAIFVTMAGESAGLPISSEIVVPLGGALAAQGKLNFVAVVIVSSVANLSGSLV